MTSVYNSFHIFQGRYAGNFINYVIRIEIKIEIIKIFHC